jgi:hypothetical protein
VCPIGAPHTAVVPLGATALVHGATGSHSQAPGHGQPQERGRFEWWNRDQHGDWHGQGHGGGRGQGQGQGHDEGHGWNGPHGHGHDGWHGRGHGHHPGG